jgi:two-component system chemotaxis response regulator CheV
MPKLNKPVRGIVHIRGQTISVIDMSLALGGKKIKELSAAFIKITEYNNSAQKFFVGSVECIINSNWQSLCYHPKGVAEQVT